MSEKKSDITENGAVELEESALDQVTGAGDGTASGWKVSEMDGKSNTIYSDATRTTTKWKVNGFDGKGNDTIVEK